MMRYTGLLLVVVIGFSSTCYAELFGKSNTEKISTAKAPARADGLSSLGGGKQRINFRFGQISAWLNTDGDWTIEGQIHHSSLRCAHYELGLRFGAGNPGCTNVEWLMETEYVTNQRQCNSATVSHTGGLSSHYIGKDFHRITCAERSIRCRGKCQ
jgi:hypothetical protein